MTLCDIGNTSYHFHVKEETFKIALSDSLENLELLEPIYYISVNDKAKEKFLTYYPKSINLQDKIQFNTQYANTLGIDRIVACCACTDGIIVDFGSAITVDIMQHNQHLGGFIMPGLEKLKSIYPDISPKLEFDYIQNLSLHDLPDNTDKAISFAINSMIVSPIINLYHFHNLPLIITGEHGKKFLHYFEHVNYEPKLIFKNMKFIIESTRNTQ